MPRAHPRRGRRAIRNRVIPDRVIPDRVITDRVITDRVIRNPLLSVVALVVLAGCAPVLPSLSGGSTTPHDREDLAVGIAARAPALDLSGPSEPGDDELLTLAGPGGLVPVGSFRAGLQGGWDLGAIVAGSGGRLEVRSGGLLGSSLTYHVGVALSGAYQGSESRQTAMDETLSAAEGFRVGALVPVGIGLALGGIFEAWGTVRLGAEYLNGTVGIAAGDAWVLRSGLALGVGVGFRRVHVLVELAVDFEHVRGQLAGNAIERSGIVLTPAAALRIRF